MLRALFIIVAILASPRRYNPFFNSDGTLKRPPAGPGSDPPRTLLLRYEDFGPQSLAYEFLGMQWWQWEGGGSFEMDDEMAIRVVVYHGVSLENVKARYPTKRALSWDYRYVERDDALRYLGAAIAEVQPAPDDEPGEAAIFLGLQDDLWHTRARIVSALGVR